MIGPQIPTQLKRKRDGEEEEKTPSRPSPGLQVGPQRPASVAAGPQMPETLRKDAATGTTVLGPTVGPQRPVGPQMPGPELPAGPQLPKDATTGTTASIGPQRPTRPQLPTGPQLPGPQLPGPQLPSERKVVGPTMPPAPLDQMPSYPANGKPSHSSHSSHPESDSDSDYGPAPPKPSSKPSAADDDDESSDDDFGPRPPPTSTTAADEAAALARLNQRGKKTTSDAPSNKPQREEWMLAPPTENMSARMDPSKLKSRKFQSGKGAKAPSYGAARSGASSLWTETPEQKRQRLADELLGVARPAYQGTAEDGRSERRKREEEETARRMRKEIEKTRGESLVKVHSELRRKEGKEDEDDPSKRAFDWEKDMKGRSIGNVQKREMMNRAKDFGGRFDTGRFL